MLSPEVAGRTPTTVTLANGFSRISSPVTILVAGAPGAGKDMLCDSWTTAQRGSPDPTEMSDDREDMNFVVARSRTMWFPKRTKVTLTIVPGQASRDMNFVVARSRTMWFPKRTKVTLTIVPGQASRERTRTFGDRLMPGHTTMGAVYVTCWGHNEIWDTRGDAALVRKVLRTTAGSPGHRLAEDHLKKLRELLLKREEQDLEDALQRLAASWVRNPAGGRPRFLMVAVNKADLFWSRIDEALEYYRTSAFGRRLAAFGRRFGLEVDVVAVSTGPQRWDPDPLLACSVEPDLEPADSLVLLTEFFARLEAHCGVR
ncbi:hypothetical protein AB0J72_54470 [Dactylosporangium sp. NPDC049742]|uniref:hypothetical protein n=1 Tax=Dactylosporangium sp. NPDC049742 TaxID=3154737 RepID=UPI0034291FC9